MNETLRIILLLVNITCSCIIIYCLIEMNKNKKEIKEIEKKKLDEIQNQQWITHVEFRPHVYVDGYKLQKKKYKLVPVDEHEEYIADKDMKEKIVKREFDKDLNEFVEYEFIKMNDDKADV